MSKDNVWALLDAGLADAVQLAAAETVIGYTEAEIATSAGLQLLDAVAERRPLGRTALLAAIGILKRQKIEQRAELVELQRMFGGGANARPH